MIDEKTVSEMQQSVEDFWKQQVRQPWFMEYVSKLASGQTEFGQMIAHDVDKKTAEHLRHGYTIRCEYTTKGKNKGEKIPRSMGDVWVEDGDYFYPINIKTGLADKKGQPNMVAMSRLLKALIACTIDSYYLMIIKFTMPATTSMDVIPNVYFVDMLDYIDCLHYNAGPGQIMLKENQFYSAVKHNRPPLASPEEKVAELLKKYEKGVKDLFKKREESVAAVNTTHCVYKNSAHILDQKALKLRLRQ